MLRYFKVNQTNPRTFMLLWVLLTPVANTHLCRTALAADGGLEGDQRAQPDASASTSI
jgi:hypothetical protein